MHGCVFLCVLKFLNLVFIIRSLQRGLKMTIRTTMCILKSNQITTFIHFNNFWYVWLRCWLEVVKIIHEKIVFCFNIFMACFYSVLDKVGCTYVLLCKCLMLKVLLERLWFVLSEIMINVEQWSIMCTL